MVLDVLPFALLILFLLPLFFGKLRYYGCRLVFTIFVANIGLSLLPIFLFRPKNARNNILVGYAGRLLNPLIGIKWELRNGDELRIERGAVITANHQSAFDILGMCNFWDVMDKCVAVAKKELFYFLPFGVAAWATGTVFIDRNRPHHANSTLDRSTLLLTRQKTKLWMFPEGTRNRKPDTFLPFKRGAFRMAITCQVPIIPVVFSPYYFIDHKNKKFGRGRIIVEVLDAIPTVGKTEEDMPALMEETRNKMLAVFERLKQEVLTQDERSSKKKK